MPLHSAIYRKSPRLSSHSLDDQMLRKQEARHIYNSDPPRSSSYLVAVAASDFSGAIKILPCRRSIGRRICSLADVYHYKYM